MTKKQFIEQSDEAITDFDVFTASFGDFKHTGVVLTISNEEVFLSKGDLEFMLNELIKTEKP